MWDNVLPGAVDNAEPCVGNSAVAWGRLGVTAEGTTTGDATAVKAGGSAVAGGRTANDAALATAARRSSLVGTPAAPRLTSGDTPTDAVAGAGAGGGGTEAVTVTVAVAVAAAVASADAIGDMAGGAAWS